jgi:hypothetical protein
MLGVMAMSQEHLEVIVNQDGTVNVPAQEISRLGARPGEHLRLVRGDEDQLYKRKSVRGLGVGKIGPQDLLTWEDFEATHEANVRAAKEKYGEVSE